jgi:glyoxylase-like metal-dependent hydrolase (beta-lactamase superfamily II)
MPTGTVHTIAADLHVIEGYHPPSLWDDPELPTVVIYRTGTTVYLLDTGAGPEQRDAIRRLVAQYDGQIDRILLLNSHGHLDHLGNNDVLAELAAGRETQHYIAREARSSLELESTSEAYQRGLPYFDYLRGLDLRAEDVAALLRAAGADDTLTATDVAKLGACIQGVGVTPALNGFLPALVVDLILRTYPPLRPSVATMTDFEDYADARDIGIGSTRWSGWTFLGDDDAVDVHVLQSGGHSAGGVVFYLPRQRFLMMADETTSVPLRADSDPRRAITTARKALTMLDEGRLTSLCAGHRPMSVLNGDDARAALRGVVNHARQFSVCVDDVLARHPGGIGIDDMYDVLVREAQADSIISSLRSLQFPVFPTFLKLTLLHHCLLLDLPNRVGPEGRPVFTSNANRA